MLGFVGTTLIGVNVVVRGRWLDLMNVFDVRFYVLVRSYVFMRLKLVLVSFAGLD